MHACISNNKQDNPENDGSSDVTDPSKYFINSNLCWNNFKNVILKLELVLNQLDYFGNLSLLPLTLSHLNKCYFN